MTVAVSRDDIERYYDNEFSDMIKTAEVPGFRPGHAPRKLIETRFRKDVGDRVKGALLMDAIAQANEEESLSAISEPDLDADAIILPEDGPMTFEFDLEVRPEFDVPQWKGLKIEKPVREITDTDVDRQLEVVLSRYGKLVPHEGAAESGDYLTCNLTFKHDGKELSKAEEEVIRVRPVLSFRDGKIDDFGKLMEGVEAGQTREGKATLSEDAPNVALRGQEVTAEFEVVEVKKLELPELDSDFLATLGGYESEADLRDAIRDLLANQLQYEQRQKAREQITAALTVSADWDLPTGLLERQSRRELQRAVLELQRSGFGEEEIRAHENELRQNSNESTAKALKEHFILERIAEDQGIETTEEDLEMEMLQIAYQTGETLRRVRSRVDKGGMMDALSNQVVERKVVDLILEQATFEEVPFEFSASEAEAIDQAAGGHDDDIPEAKPEESKPEEKASAEGEEA